MKSYPESLHNVAILGTPLKTTEIKMIGSSGRGRGAFGSY